MVCIFSVGASKADARTYILPIFVGRTENLRSILIRYVGVPEANQYAPNTFLIKQLSKLNGLT